jgi:acyl carrier protein
MITKEPSDLADVVVRALATELKVSEATVRSVRSLKGELKMDSIAAVNVAFVIEEAYDLEIDLDGADEFDSVDAIVEVVRRCISERGAKGR